MNLKLWTIAIFDGILLGVAWVEWLDVTVRVTSVITGALVGWYAIQAYRSQKKLNDFNLKKAQQENEARIEKIKSNGKAK
jgi:hypothetical protein